MRKILLTYCSFVIASLFVLVAFITVTTYTQLAVAILLYPILAFFAYKVLPIKQRHTVDQQHKQSHFSLAKPQQEAADIKITSKTANIGISDIDKRAFLKLIGGAGLTLFLFSIFNKKAEGLFFKTLPGPASGNIFLQDISGNKINPAQKKLLDDYSISDIENSTITFYGFIAKDGSWYIMRADTTTGAFRYTKDKSNFPGNWANRANLKYDYFDNVF